MKTLYEYFKFFGSSPHMTVISKNKSIAIAVQGSGKGHYSQAMAMCRLLNEKDNGKNDHEQNNPRVKLAFVNSDTKVPEYFLDFCKQNDIRCCEVPMPIYYNSNGRVENFRTLLYTFLYAPKYVRAWTSVYRLLEEYKVSALLNFYEPFFTSFHRVTNFPCTHYALSTSYKYFTPVGQNSFNFAAKLSPWFSVASLLQCIYLTQSTRENRRIILSPFPTNSKDEVACLIGDEYLFPKKKQSCPGQKKIILCYFMMASNDLFSVLDQLAAKTKERFEIHVFTEEPNAKIHTNYIVHSPSKKEFYEFQCKADCVITSSGIETIVESILLKVPVLALSPDNHFEQEWNGHYFASVLPRTVYRYFRQIDIDPTKIRDFLNVCEFSWDGYDEFKNFYLKNKGTIANVLNLR